MIRKLRAWGWRVLALAGLAGRRDRDLEEEIASHLAMHAEDNERAGLSPAEARRQAVLAFGGLESMKEQYRDRRGIPFLQTTMQDLRYALRGYRRSPGFAAAALVVLALGIGANAAIFTVVNAALLQPLPYAEPDRLVAIWHTPPQASFPGVSQFAVSAANYLDWEREQHVFERMSVQHFRTFALAGGAEPEQVRGLGVSQGFFRVFGVPPLHGRWFAADEDRPGAERVVILSHRLWQRRFGGDRGLVGRTVLLDGAPHTVVGIMGPSFTYPDWAQLWTPLAWTPEDRAVRSEHSLMVTARLAQGVSLEQAQAEMDAISARLARAYPQDNKGWGAVVVPLHEELLGDLKLSLMVLLGAVAFVLLIACANVANLVLSRTLARRTEMAVRLALGAGPGRIVRQVLTETILLAATGGALGLLVAEGGVSLIRSFLGSRLPENLALHADARVLAFTAAVSLLAGLAAGLAPALRMAKASVGEAIKQGGGRSESEAAGSRLRATLVVVEVALSLVLLVGAGLMIRSLWQLHRVDAGFDPRNVLTGWVSLPKTRYPEPEQQARVIERLLERTRALPGVEAAAFAPNLPLTNGNNWPVSIVGRPQLPLSEQPQLQGNTVTPGYLRALRIPLLRGRELAETDTADRPAVVLVSEAAAKWLWPGQDPIGQRLVVGFFPDTVREVVGVVKDVKERGLHEPGTASMYLPLAQLPFFYGAIIVRTRTASPETLGPSLVAAVREVDRDLPVEDLMPMEMVVQRSTSDTRFTMFLLAAFAGLAVLLAAVGIYSVLAYTVRRRVREIGIRVALGADRREVVRMVMADALRPALLGVAIGFAGALGLRGVMARLLFGVSPADPATFAAVAGLLVAVAVGSSVLPAYRATRVDPVVALRDE